MNGERSIIAINGSAIGLSHYFESRNHDALSAIISSAPVHNLLSDDSLLSTIAVNGDVIIPGGTFQSDDDGIFTGLLEDASVFWYEDPNGIRIPFYKMYQWTEDDILNPDKYHAELRERLRDLSAAYLNGPFNLFQLGPAENV